jgi:hypothetical protein
MKTFTRSLMIGGALAFAVPAVSLAAPAGWPEGQHILEQHLQPGKTPADYRQILTDMGYTITSTNYDTPDYVEYEIVKGDQTYEVQIDVDDETGNATEVEVEANLWKTNPTEAAVDANERDASERMVALNDPNFIMVVTPIYTADTRQRTELETMVRDLEQVPTGLDKGSYRKALEERGYQVMDSATKNDQIQFRVAKDGREALVNVRFDDATGKSEQVNAFPLLHNVTAQQQPPRSMASSSQASRPDDTQKMVQELEALPVSRDRGFYRQALRQRGFRIIDSETTNNQTRFEAEKNNRRIALDVQFDRDTGKSTNVDVTSLSGTQSGTQQDSLSMSQTQEETPEQDQMAQ